MGYTRHHICSWSSPPAEVRPVHMSAALTLSVIKRSCCNDRFLQRCRVQYDSCLLGMQTAADCPLT